MTTLKQEVIEKIKEMPDDSKFDDLMYEMYLINKIKTGQEQFEKGEYLTHEQVVKESEQW
jgi:predicted transcriptional regulator